MGQTGTVLKMTLILKQKEDGSVKRHIILDMRGSLGNARARADERTVLPRLTDVTHMLQDMWKPRGGDKGRRESRDDDDFEFYLIDLEDAFCHFPVRKEELRHCVTPDEHDQEALVWTATLFGYKCAPLIVGRLSSALGRLLQSLLSPEETQLQVYVDDVLIAALGGRALREKRLALLLYTAAAFVVRISMKKGERGRRITWIGCVIGPGGAGGGTGSHRPQHLTQIHDRQTSVDRKHPSQSLLDCQCALHHPQGRGARPSRWNRRQESSGER